MRAQSLKEVGCTYCIVGHSEIRRDLQETGADIAQKVERILEQDMQPIICIGESKQEYEAQETFTVLGKQLKLILPILKQSSAPICIAYEPIWSIGTGIIPEAPYLQKVFDWLSTTTKNNPYIRLLYGGSVNDTNAAQLLTLAHVDGFLIGGASLDFQKFQKIVSLGS